MARWLNNMNIRISTRKPGIRKDLITIPVAGSENANRILRIRFQLLPGQIIILLHEIPFFFLRLSIFSECLPYDYIEAHHDPGEDGYNYSEVDPAEWLSFTARQIPVFNVGVAYKQQLSDNLMFSGGFRTDFDCIDPASSKEFPYNNKNTAYHFNVYHVNYGLGFNFKRGSIILGMQFSHGQVNDQRQIVNLTEPVEYISDTQMPLTGEN